MQVLGHSWEVNLVIIDLGKPVIKAVCKILSDIVDIASGEATTARKIVYNSVESVLALCTEILPHYITLPGI